MEMTRFSISNTSTTLDIEAKHYDIIIAAITVTKDIDKKRLKSLVNYVLTYDTYDPEIHPDYDYTSETKYNADSGPAIAVFINGSVYSHEALHKVLSECLSILA